MIGAIFRPARRLDEFLKERLGRPYNVILSVGLIIEIVHRIRDLIEFNHTLSAFARPAIVVIYCLALLTNQLAELSEHIERKGPHR